MAQTISQHQLVDFFLQKIILNEANNFSMTMDTEDVS